MNLSPEELNRLCKRFRVLIIGRRNAGKTTILEKMTRSEAGTEPEIRDEEGELVAEIDPTLLRGGLKRGMSVIDYEITYPSNPRFVFHDSRGIEAGAESVETKEGAGPSELCTDFIQKFIDERAKEKSLEDQLHAIWFCMPMDTPRVPSDEFELAFLEKINSNVPVIAVLTKYEALVDRVKLESKGKQVTNRDVLNYANREVFGPLKTIQNKPAAIVQTHHKGKGCELLSQKTFEALKNETLATIFGMSQQNSMKLACQIVFKQDLAQPIFLKLKLATKMDNTKALYDHLVDMGIKFLPSWNLVHHTVVNYNNDDLKVLNHHNLKDVIYLYLLDKEDEQYTSKITSAIIKWLNPNSSDIFKDGFYMKFITFACVIGCIACQHSKTPWKFVTQAIDDLDEEMRSQVIKGLEAIHQKHKYGSKEFCAELADLIVGIAASAPCKHQLKH